MARFPAPTHDTPAARLHRLLAPGFSYCLRCGEPWSRVHGHITDYGGGSGCFPLCDWCWELLGHPEARAPYYGALIAVWDADMLIDPDRANDIRRAVASEPITAVIEEAP